MRERREKPDGTGRSGKPRSGHAAVGGREARVAPGSISPSMSPLVSPSVSPEGALALQRTAGNHVVSRLLDAAPKRQARSVQRLVEYQVDDDSDADAQQAFVDCVKGVDEAVQWAHDYVTSFPGLGELAELDGHTKHWKEVWEGALSRQHGGGLHKEFGYVVESLATYRMQKTLVLPGGYTIGLQHPFGGTRPDVVLYGPRSRCVAALDITASSSGGHIWKKDQWEARFPRIAEISYPSLVPATVIMMIGNKDATGPVSGEELANFRAQAEERHAALMERCKAIKADFTATVEPLFERRRELFGLDPALARRTVIKWFTSGRFNVEDAEELYKTAAGVLAALNIDGKRFGFSTGFTGSVARGQSFLLAADNPDSTAWGKPVPEPNMFGDDQPRPKRKGSGEGGSSAKRSRSEELS